MVCDGLIDGLLLAIEVHIALLSAIVAHAAYNAVSRVTALQVPMSSTFVCVDRAAITLVAADIMPPITA